MEISPYCDEIQFIPENEMWTLKDALNDLMMSGSYASVFTAHATIVESAKIAGFDPFTTTMRADDWVNAIVSFELNHRYAN